MLIMTGTGMLSDKDITPLGLHYDILRWAIVAKLCRCKVLFVSVGLGPIQRPFSRLLVKMALMLAEYRSYRDAFSKAYSKELGFAAEPDEVYPDLAFSLPQHILPCTTTRRRRTVVGVGLITDDKRRNNLADAEGIYYNYITGVGRFVAWLVEHQYTVRLIIGDAIYDNRARRDLKTFLEQSGVNYAHGAILDQPAHSVDGLLAQLAETDVVIASRFHNVLLALMLGKPVIAVSFHEKVTSLMTAMGLTRFCQDIEAVDVHRLIDQFGEIERDADKIRSSIEAQSEVYRTVLEAQYQHLFGTAEPNEDCSSNMHRVRTGSDASRGVKGKL